MHKIVPYSAYMVPDMNGSTQRITLLTKIGGPVPREDITFAQLYNAYLRPGHLVHATRAMPSILPGQQHKAIADNIPDRYNTYAIVKAGTTHAHVKPNPTGTNYATEDKSVVRGLGPLKEIHLLGSSTPDHWRFLLDKAYQMIEIGYPIEFSMKIRHQKLRDYEALVPGPKDYWPTLHNHFPHLRPGFLLKSMPVGTRYLVPPWTDGRTLKWAFALQVHGHEKDLARRLEQVKQLVLVTVQQGKQRSLPMKLRSAIESRDEAALKVGWSQAGPGSGPTEPVAHRLSKRTGLRNLRKEFLGEDDLKDVNSGLAETSSGTGLTSPEDERYNIPLEKDWSKSIRKSRREKRRWW